ncbi:MAG: cell surface protein [Verrucomicrobia bacterium]|nr:cell surface protein [Verrucomicrobiota bacterium]
MSPTALVAAADGQTIYVACATDACVVELTASGDVRRRIELPDTPSGLALSPDGRTLAITCAAPQSTVCLVDTQSGKITARWPAGHTTMAPVFSPDGGTLFVCNRFNDEVAALDVRTGKTLARIPVVRQPVAAAITPDGRRLWVANHLPGGAADRPHVAAAVSVIDPSTRAVVATLELPNGSGLLLGLAVSPDGRTVAVTHNLAHFQLPTTQVEHGWMNNAALTLIDVASLRLATLVLDEIDAGAANPWAVAWSPDGAQLLVTHAGTHEVSVIDAAALQRKLASAPNTATAQAVSSDLTYLLGLRQRVPLQGRGPRALAVVAGRAWVADYFSDAVESIDLTTKPAPSRLMTMGPHHPVSLARRGEEHFNDATLCFQHWQSCATCHSWDARVDGFNWDLLNDGIGNPKNSKSLLLAHRTPPAMSTGIRDSAEVAVRSGFRYIQFAAQSEEVATAVDAYLKSLRPVPSPRLEDGRLSATAQRGRRLFADGLVGCESCHTGRDFTDLHSYAVGTANAREPATTRFDTPTLVELWRTAPYLHDGSAVSLRSLLTERNPQDRHGHTSQLNPAQIDDLVAYLLSL